VTGRGRRAAKAALGDAYLGQDRRRGARWFFRTRGPVGFNLSGVPLGSALWTGNLAVRDHLGDVRNTAETRHGADAGG
jgi:hypothetical protein